MRRAASVLLLSCLTGACGCGGGRPRGPMSDGERAYRSKCAACHRLYEPGERTREQWESAVAKMERLKKVRLSQADEDLILGYLAGRQAPVPPADPLPAPEPVRPPASAPPPGSEASRR